MDSNIEAAAVEICFQSKRLQPAPISRRDNMDMNINLLAFPLIEKATCSWLALTR